MNQSVTETPKVFRGRFVDLLEAAFPVVTEKEVAPDSCALLFDLDRIGEDFRVVATCARVEAPEFAQDRISLRLRTAANIRSYTRLRLPKAPSAVTASAEITWQWDEISRTVLLEYRSTGDAVTVTLIM